MLSAALSFSRYYKVCLLMLMDALLLPLALLSAVLLRLGGEWDPLLSPFGWLFIILPLWVLPIFVHLGLYRAALKYVDDKVVLTMFLGVTLAVLVLTAVITMFRITPFPRTAIVIFWIFAMAYIGGSRFLIRGFLRRIGANEKTSIPVIIYGAGQAGLQLMMALQAGPEYRPVAFLDDNSQLWGKTYRGLGVYNPKIVVDLIQNTGAQAILLAIPSASRSQQRKIIEHLEPLHIDIKRLPGMAGLISGDVTVEELRPVDIDDLLGRDIVPPKQELLEANIKGMVVMVTGAGGSIGSELCMQIVQARPRLLVLYEISEFALYSIDQALAKNAPDIPRVSLLGSVTDLNHLCGVMQRCKVETVFHAAAYKHVPLVEYNPVAGIINNVFGTDICAEAAIRSRINTFVLISTDKAVRPTNVMGASKRLAELILQARHDKGVCTRFVMVRFGNVLGSSGSVIPLFRQQISTGGPVTVTHQEVTRFFMTIPEAAQLVIQAGAMGEGGDVFVLDMGEAVSIAELAKRMIRLSGLSVKDRDNPEGDIEIIYTGLRPGEKLYEELIIGDRAQPTEHPRILRAQESFFASEDLQPQLESLKLACNHRDADVAFKLLHQIVVEFHGAQNSSDLLQFYHF